MQGHPKFTQFFWFENKPSGNPGMGCILSPEQMNATPPVDTVQFSVLLRKGTKLAYKEVAVAADSDIAKNLQKQEEADRLEKERVKRLTLEMNERQEEEDLHEAIAPVSERLLSFRGGPGLGSRQTFSFIKESLIPSPT
jgi:hypothetical protein